MSLPPLYPGDDPQKHAHGGTSGKTDGPLHGPSNHTRRAQTPILVLVITIGNGALMTCHLRTWQEEADEITTPHVIHDFLFRCGDALEVDAPRQSSPPSQSRIESQAVDDAFRGSGIDWLDRSA